MGGNLGVGSSHILLRVFVFIFLYMFGTFFACRKIGHGLHALANTLCMRYRTINNDTRDKKKWRELCVTKKNQDICTRIRTYTGTTCLFVRYA